MSTIFKLCEPESWKPTKSLWSKIPVWIKHRLSTKRTPWQFREVEPPNHFLSVVVVWKMRWGIECTQSVGPSYKPLDNCGVYLYLLPRLVIIEKSHHIYSYLPVVWIVLIHLDGRFQSPWGPLWTALIFEYGLGLVFGLISSQTRTHHWKITILAQ